MKITGANILIEELIRHKVEHVFGFPGGYVINIYDELYKNAHRITHILTAHEQGAAHAADAYARVSGKTGVVLATGGPGATNLVTGIANAYLDSVPVVFITGNVAVPMLGQDSFQDIDIVDVTLPIVKHSYVVKDIGQLQNTIREAFLIASTGRKGPVHIDIPKSIQLGICNYDPNPAVKAPETSHSSDSGGADNSGIDSGGTEFSSLDSGGADNSGIDSCGVDSNSIDSGGADSGSTDSSSADSGSTDSGGADSSSTDSGGIDAAVDLIARSKRPYIYCGGGVTATDTGRQVMLLSKKIGAPVGMSMMGIGSVPASYDLTLGMSGMHGRYASIAAKSEADLIVALGVRFSDRATGNASEYSRGTAVIHIDIDAAELGKNIRPEVALCGDLKDILPVLLDKVQPKSNAKWLSRIKELKEKDDIPPGNDFTPRNIISRVSGHYDDETVVATDVGQHQMWVAQYYKFEKPRKLISSGGLGAMGYGLGAAIGASIATGGKRTLLLTGDGSFGMNLTEMATAVTQKLPITIILLNNSALGMVRQWQSLFYDARYSSTTLERKTDFPALAKAFGAAGYRASSLEELDEALAKAPCGLPCLIECKIDIDEKVLPMIPVGGTIDDIILE